MLSMNSISISINSIGTCNSINHIGMLYHIKLNERLSTDSLGLASAMGLKAEARIEFDLIVRTLVAKISDNTLLTI